jgi:predicted metal-dependent phosphoesterase TrpH
VTRRSPRGTPGLRPALIDLHLHTTASDGRCTPEALVRRAAGAGLTVIAVTDHDTTAAVHDVQRLADACGIECVSGIEVTAIEDGGDVHVLGYFVDPRHEPLQEFLAAQRRSRVTRAIAIADRLRDLGRPIDVRQVLRDAERDSTRAVGRPQIARAMIAAGHAADVTEAFDRWLGRGAPAFVARTGAPPEEVIAVIHDAGGLASLAHPGRTGIDARIEALCRGGLDALEVYHSDHDAAQVARYLAIARDLRRLVTGGSDYHGDPGRALSPGAATLPEDEWLRLRAAGRRHA